MYSVDRFLDDWCANALSIILNRFWLLNIRFHFYFTYFFTRVLWSLFFELMFKLGRHVAAPQARCSPWPHCYFGASRGPVCPQHHWWQVPARSQHVRCKWCSSIEMDMRVFFFRFSFRGTKENQWESMRMIDIYRHSPILFMRVLYLERWCIQGLKMGWFWEPSWGALLLLVVPVKARPLRPGCSGFYGFSWSRESVCTPGFGQTHPDIEDDIGWYWTIHDRWISYQKPRAIVFHCFSRWRPGA